MGTFTLWRPVPSRTGRTGSPATRARVAGRRGGRRLAPLLERLEDRTVLSPTVYTVTGWGDSPADPQTPTSGDLRYCIGLADANTSNPEGSLVQFDPTVFNVPRTITLGSGLTLSNAMVPTTITGPGASSLTVSGGGLSSNFSVFTVNSGVTMSITGLTIANGWINSNSGGGVFNSGNLSLTNVTLSGNWTDGYGGGVFNDGTATLTNDTLSGNSAAGESGGGVFNDGTATLTNDTLSGNSAPGGFGGGVYNFGDGTATLTNDTLSGNSAWWGGGVYNYNNVGMATVTLTNDTFSGNSADYGGGVCISTGTATLTNDTFSGNSAQNSGYGGGIVIYTGTATLTNDTLCGNSAYRGGGVWNGGTATLTNDTLSGNSATEVGGGIFGTATLNNTIVAHSPIGGDIYGTVTGSNNLIDDAANAGGLTNGVGGNIVGVNSWFGTLGNYGGPTQTIPLLPGSPAIGAGSTALAVDGSGNPLTTDQRGTGFARTLNGMVDIGAFEDQISGTAPGSQNATQGVSGSFTLGSFSDQATPSTSWSVDVSWGDGSTDTTLLPTSQGSLGSASHTYNTAGPETVTVTVADSYDDVCQYSFSVNVRAPTSIAVTPASPSVARASPSSSPRPAPTPTARQPTSPARSPGPRPRLPSPPSAAPAWPSRSPPARRRSRRPWAA